MNKYDLDKATRIHYSFLPASFSNQWVDLSLKYKPIYSLGGDYCSTIWLTDSRLLICMCDVVGHGVASALYAARVNTFVLTHAEKTEHPCELMIALNKFLCATLSGVGVYTTFFTVVIDFKLRQLEYASAAHPPAILYSPSNNTCEMLNSETTLLGFMDMSPQVCQLRRLPIKSGDRLVIYTDGLVERSQDGGNAEKPGWLHALMLKHTELNSSKFCELVMREAEKCFGPAQDDQLLMSILVK